MSSASSNNVKTFFNKLFSKDKPKLSQEKITVRHGKMEDTTILRQEDDKVRFARLYSENGGKFLYTENRSELLNFIENIAKENDFENFWCIKPELQHYLKNLKIDYKTKPYSDKQINLIDCEYLIAFNGSIMVSSDQTDNRKLHELSKIFVVLAYTDQIVKNISEGLQKIKSLKKNNIPTNITTIKGLNYHAESKSVNSGNIYLLLTERAVC